MRSREEATGKCIGTNDLLDEIREQNIERHNMFDEHRFESRNIDQSIMDR